jgi:two-component system C4-dicarboxylate transport sensor histidine kinase DctB
MRRGSILFSIGFTTLALLFALGYFLGYATGLRTLAERTEQSLVQVNERLLAQLEKYQYLPATIIGYPQLAAALASPDAASVSAANIALQRWALTSGALDIYLMDQQGTTIAASNFDLDRNFIGQNFSWRPYFKSAILGSLTRYNAVGTTSRQRGFYFAHPVYGADGSIIGVLAVKLDLGALESEWRGIPNAIFFSDSNNVIFVSNRDALVLGRIVGPDTKSEIEDAERQYAGIIPAPLTQYRSTSFLGYEIWRDVTLDGLPERGLHLSKHDLLINMDAHILVSIAGVEAQARVWGTLAASLGGILLLAGAVVQQRRLAMAAALLQEEQAKLTLETKVKERTRDLSVANTNLRREVDERIAAEAELRKVQDELVQAAKLSALGEMSAGISHELNQPLAAIQVLADNADLLLDRQDPAMVRENVGKISQMAERAGRIIRNLRAFARKEDETITDVDIHEVIKDAINLIRPKLTKQATELIWEPANRELLVRGGRVRLQQVIMNLIANASDAMMDQSDPRQVRITVTPVDDQIHVNVSDTGPGLKQPDQVFDPFYTTKTVGEGLGLGLSISYGIVQSFGGDISGTNNPEGGATFTVKLTPSKPKLQAIA